MKKISLLLALFALVFTELAMAGAVVTSLAGTAQAQGASGSARTLRQGDEVNQGDTVTTGSASSVVLRFDDGQVAALTSNSSMQVTSYQYNAQQKSGNVLLSLISGGMRAVTGLIGRSNPQAVSYKAATATIGIRGTDVVIITSQGNITVSVNEGEISFTMNGRTVTINAGFALRVPQTATFFAAVALNALLRELPPAERREFDALEKLEIRAAIASALRGGPGSTIDVRPPPSTGGGGGGGPPASGK